MSSQTVTLGTQTITPKVEDLGNTYYIEFQVKITKYLNNPTNQTIDVKFTCNKYKQVAVPRTCLLYTSPSPRDS